MQNDWYLRRQGDQFPVSNSTIMKFFLLGSLSMTETRPEMKQIYEESVPPFPTLTKKSHHLSEAVGNSEQNERYIL